VPITTDVVSSNPAQGYQVSVHLAKRFQIRNKKGENLTDHGCQVMAKTHVAFGLVWFYGL
jgi:hypothetical protein